MYVYAYVICKINKNSAFTYANYSTNFKIFLFWVCEKSCLMKKIVPLHHKNTLK